MSDLSFPFEDVPGGPIPWQGKPAHLTGGFTMASVLVPTEDGRGEVPGIMFSFAKFDGLDFHRPLIVLIDDAQHGKRLKVLISRAIASALKAAGK